ncbi:DUF4232 domain-containing protein [Streptomyces sp. RY43-2]|uniref:DUF4232 domain-containing protein n=1 Tax=Streptomyces macrolidinus TaxID=2952607 RepID=A0ABT0ZL60_9ACTN|nr:DUF4232 domain-containing protein [Streptomyces macrolidinus]MCN9244330.1 DUF4232 domain-containing protein [Streptomyces macrolidinus]
MRTALRENLALGAVAALALALSACNGGESTNSASAPADSGPGTGTEDSKAAKGQQSEGMRPSRGAKKSPECKATSLGYALKREFAGQQGDHLLITAVNKSGTACTVRKFPIVTPDKAGGNVPLDRKQDDQPTQPVLVPAGGTVYSAILIYDPKAGDGRFSSVRLSLAMNNVEDSRAFVTLKTPGEVKYATKERDSLTVLSWNSGKPYDF